LKKHNNSGITFYYYILNIFSKHFEFIVLFLLYFQLVTPIYPCQNAETPIKLLLPVSIDSEWLRYIGYPGNYPVDHYHRGDLYDTSPL